MHNQQLFVYLFLLTGVMSSANNSENEMSSVEAAHSTTSSYDDEGKLHKYNSTKKCCSPKG